MLKKYGFLPTNESTAPTAPHLLLDLSINLYL